jgi:hypothetical protein
MLTQSWDGNFLFSWREMQKSGAHSAITGMINRRRRVISPTNDAYMSKLRELGSGGKP